MGDHDTDTGKIYIDVCGYEKHLESICMISLRDLIEEEQIKMIKFDKKAKRVAYFQCDNDSSDLLKEAVQRVRKVVFQNLGIPKDLLARDKNLKVFLAVSMDKHRNLVGYVEAHPLSSAHKYVTDLRYPDDLLPCASVYTIPVKCGVSALWVRPRCRKRGIATDLLRLVKGKMFDDEINWPDIAYAFINTTGQRFVIHFFKKITADETRTDPEKETTDLEPSSLPPVYMR